MGGGEGLLVADCDMAIITKRKRMMDSVGHYARPELLHLHHDARPTSPVFRHGDDEMTASPSVLPRLPAFNATAHPVTTHPKEDHARTPDGTADQRVAVLRSATG